MAEKSTVARPYAQAVFELAQEQDALAAWSDMLSAAAVVGADPTMQQVLASVQVTRQTVADLFVEACGESLNDSGRNFVRVLADNHRLDLVDEVAEQYTALRAEAERTVDARVATAFELSEQQQAKLAAALTKHLGRDVRLECEIDKTLIGGAVIHAGDLVIDGSALGRLDRLTGQLEG